MQMLSQAGVALGPDCCSLVAPDRDLLLLLNSPFPRPRSRPCSCLHTPFRGCSSRLTSCQSQNFRARLPRTVTAILVGIVSFFFRVDLYRLKNTQGLPMAHRIKSAHRLPRPYGFRGSVRYHHYGEHGGMQADMVLATS